MNDDMFPSMNIGVEIPMHECRGCSKQTDALLDGYCRECLEDGQYKNEIEGDE